MAEEGVKHVLRVVTEVLGDTVKFTVTAEGRVLFDCCLVGTHADQQASALLRGCVADVIEAFLE